MFDGTYKDQIIQALGYVPRNVETLDNILDIASKSKGIASETLRDAVGLSPNAFYRSIKLLRECNLLREDNTVGSLLRKVEWKHLNNITERKEITANKYHQLACYLTKYKPEEIVPPFNLQRKEVEARVKEEIFRESARLVELAGEYFAKVAFATDTVDNFYDYVGTLSPIKAETYPELNS